MTIVRLVLLSFLALSCHADENEPCKLSDCGPHSCRTKRSGDVCYYVIYKTSSFQDAQDACRDVGMTLATPRESPVPDDVISGLLTIHGAWLNGFAKELQRWSFTNGKTMIMTGTGTDCGAMFSRYDWGNSGRVDYFFRPRPCYEPNKFLCRKDNCSPLTNECIIHDPNIRKDWFAAREYCSQRNADLFYLNENEDGDNMAAAFGWSYHNVGNIFVGLRKRAWVWVVDAEDGETHIDMTRTGWKANEPNRAYKNCIKLQYTGTWDDQECDKSGPFPLCTREAIPLEDLSAEMTTESLTTPIDIKIEETTTSQKKIVIPTTLDTTTLEATTRFASTAGKVKHTTEGATSKPPSDNEDNRIATMMSTDTTNIPKPSARQTTDYPSTLGVVFEEDIVESTFIPDSSTNPIDKSLPDNENTTPKLEELKTVDTQVRMVTLRGEPIHVVTPRGRPTTTTFLPPRREYENESKDDKGSLKTLTQFVLYKMLSNSAPPAFVPYLGLSIALLLLLKDLFN